MDTFCFRCIYYAITVFTSTVRKLAAKTIVSITEKQKLKLANNAKKKKTPKKKREYIQ